MPCPDGHTRPVLILRRGPSIGDSKAQKAADYLEELDHQLDFGMARESMVVAIATKGVFQSVWNYNSTCWKDTVADLKKNKQHEGCHLVEDKLYKEGRLCVPKEQIPQ